MIVLILALAGCSNQSVIATAQSQASQPPAAVQTARASIKDVARVITLPADAVPWQQATIYAKVAGYLDKVYVDKGDKVNAGQILATIRTPELQASRGKAEQTFLSAEAAAKVSQATRRKSQDEVRRAQAVADKARADYRQAPAGVARAKAQAQQADSALKRAQDQRAQAEAAVEESQTQIAKAQADFNAAQSDEKLANITLDRYRRIYDKDARLIAKQQVDEAWSRVDVAAAKSASAQGQIDSAKSKLKSAEAQLRATTHAVQEYAAAFEAARDQVAIADAQRASMQKQIEIATRDVAVSMSAGAASDAQAKQAELQAAAFKDAQTEASIMMMYGSLRAPFAGTVTKRLADPGAFIQTAATSQNAAPIAEISDLTKMRIYIHVPESEARYVHPGTRVELSAGTMGDEVIKATVTRTSESLDTKSRTLLAEIDVPNSSRAILPGSYLSARVELEKHSNAVSVPSGGIGVEKAGRFVYVVQGGKAKRIPVTVGFDNGRIAEVKDGLKGGEEVVIKGRDALSPGSPVTTSAWIPDKPAKH
jgi:RND family efflux transporter MFP subunit